MNNLRATLVTSNSILLYSMYRVTEKTKMPPPKGKSKSKRKSSSYKVENEKTQITAKIIIKRRKFGIFTGILILGGNDCSEISKVGFSWNWLSLSRVLKT